MRTLILQHSTEESAGTLIDWLQVRSHPYAIKYVEKDPIDPTAFDCLVVLGGPMNVDEESKYPWLKREKQILNEWLKTEKPFLGICLGGQMLAQALGAKVTKNTHREIGWHEITKHESHPAFDSWPERSHVFQWHEDRFSLPNGCKKLFGNDVTEFQAFSYGKKTIGLQFHPEATEKWIRGNYSTIRTKDEPYVQGGPECFQQLPTHLPSMKKRFFQFLDDLTK